jgi:GTP1/Obg family GTP-binding protein
MRNEGLKIKIRRSELLEKVRAQRTKHVAEYEEAMQAWRNMMHAAAEKIVKDFVHLEKFPKSLLKLTQCPEHHVDDFDTNIAMLESAQDELIELDQENYERLVLGKFEWRDSFLATNAFYGSAREVGLDSNLIT